MLYRGKDFLPPAVQAALEERDAMARALQEEEERVRMAGRSNAVQLADAPPEPRYKAALFFYVPSHVSFLSYSV